MAKGSEVPKGWRSLVTDDLVSNYREIRTGPAYLHDGSILKPAGDQLILVDQPKEEQGCRRQDMMYPALSTMFVC